MDDKGGGRSHPPLSVPHFAMSGYWFSPQSTPHRGVPWGLNRHSLLTRQDSEKNYSWQWLGKKQGGGVSANSLTL